MSIDPRRRAVEGAVRSALALFPPRFRHRYGTELLGVVRRRLGEEQRRGGTGAALRYLLDTLRDICAAALRTRWRAARGNRAPRPPRHRGRGNGLDGSIRNLRHTVRALRREPLLVSVIVLSLGLGIGANTAIFSVVDAVMIETLPVPEPRRLVVPLIEREPGRIAHNFSVPDFRDLESRSRSLSGLAAYSLTDGSLEVSGAGTRLSGQYVSGSYFPTLGVDAAVGRLLVPSDDAADAPPVLVLAHDLWRSRFGGDPSVVGRSITFNGFPMTIVGVAPEGFTGTYPGTPARFWVPLSRHPETITGFLRGFDLLDERAASWLYLIGRLAPAVTREAAQEELRGIARALARENPQTNDDRTEVLLMPGGRGHHGALDELTPPLVSLLAVTGALLLIACANVANLLLARTIRRRDEMSVRLALGASRGRLVRQLLAESLLLASLGGGVGVVVAIWGADTTARLLVAVSDRPLVLDGSLDLGVLGLALVVSVLTGVACGLAPAWRAAQADPARFLAGAGGRAGLGSVATSQRLLLISQVALSTVLLVGAALLARSVFALRAVDSGVDPAGLLVVSVDPSLAGHEDAVSLQTWLRIREAVGALPGVRGVSMARVVPVDAGGSRGSVWIPGRDEPTDEIDRNAVDVGYFDLLGISLLRGRGFQPSDRAGTPSVAVVNRTFAERFWPGGDPLGETIRLWGVDGPESRIVGVTEDGKYRSLREEPRPYIWVPVRQQFRPDLELVVRAAGSPLELVDPVRTTIRAIDPDVPVHDARTLAQQIASSYFETRVSYWLLVVFSGLGLLLAGSGIHGLLGYAVGCRRHEIGVRIALGARSPDVVALVVRQGMALALVGVAIGAVVAVASGRFVGSLLYGVEPTDPTTLLVATVFLCGVALTSCWMPARRAAGVDPLVALRD